MSRVARENRRGHLYHVISRFVDRSWVLTDHEERQTYLRMFGHAMAHTDWRCLAFALMSNHLHFAMVAGEKPMSSWTKSANGNFAQWLNRRHHRLGPVFAERPDDFEVLPANHGDVIAYIHNNPVRAGVVARARDSDWTSHRAYTGRSARPSWLHVAEGLARSGFDDHGEFDAWVDQQQWDDTRRDLKAIRRAVKRRGNVNVATATSQCVPIVARPFARIRPDPDEVVRVVARITGVAATAFCSRRRVPHLIRARRLVAHAARSVGICGSDIASALGISTQAVSKMLRVPLDAELEGQVKVITELFEVRYAS